MSATGRNDKDVDIDLARLVLAIWERRGKIAAVTLIAGGVAFAASSVMSPVYRSEARVLIETRAASFGNADPNGTGSQQVLDDLNISSQTQLLQSVDLIKQVARNMKLYELPEFDPGASPSMVSRLLVMIGMKKNPLEVAPEERVISAFREKLQVYRAETSRVIAVEFSSKDPVLAAAIPNEILKVYQSLQTDAKLDANSEAARWLEPEIASLREKVREADKKVADYRASSDLLTVGENTTFATRQLGDISTELARVRGEKANAEARAENVRNALSSGRPTDTLPDIIGSQMIQRLKETESGIQSQISDLSTTMLDGHPRIKALRAQLGGIRSQIETETRKVLASLENEANVSRLRERQLVQQLNTLKADGARAGEDSVGLNDLERDATAQRQLLETYLARYREATSRTASTDSSPADARVISAAIEPREPYFPKVGPIVIVVSLVTFLLSCVVVMLIELFTGRALRPVGASRQEELETQATVVEAVAVPVAVVDVPADRIQVASDEALAAEMEETLDLTETPETLEAAEANVVDNDAAEQSGLETFSIEMVAEYLAMKGVGPVATVVSPAGDAGSTATVMLARAVSESGRTVVLVDMTASACPTRLMAPSSNLPGITDLLAGEVNFAETIHNDRLSSAHIVPQGKTPAHEAMRVIDRLTMVVSALADVYDTVLIECGAVDVVRAAGILKNLSTDIIVSAPQPDKESLTGVMQTLADDGHSRVLIMSGMSSQRHPQDSSRTAA
ncbi:chain-length determining protein [Agrobacterium sp. AGB01]|uniref:GumC family protein n=1 Tax=Agrobacterium sp. AGB01 TaxID=2769302 RepID=UPI00177F2F8C|nr:exopolysaccharide transport family protein [Agrobacterium sp. AGB01]MBD9386594.1 chain-length determining protein [Agrobacterium sp. AGB01]